MSKHADPRPHQPAGDDVPAEPPTFPWHIWRGRNYPLMADEEQQFVADLRAAAATGEFDDRKRTPEDLDNPDWNRVDVVMVMTALRCGVTADALLDQAPGLHPATLAAAYDGVAVRHRQASAAWHEVVAGGIDELEDHGAEAAVLLPVPIKRLRFVASDQPGEWDREVQEAVERVTHMRKVTDRLYDEMLSAKGRPHRMMKVSRELFDPHDSCLWSDPFFLPKTLAELTPVRVADLLGERRDEQLLL